MKSWFDKEKNWFNRHLWWTWTLGTFVIFFVAFLPLFLNSPDPPFWVSIWWVLWVVLGEITMMLYVEIIYLKQKKRSLWFLLLNVMGYLGMGIIMSLKEKVDEKLL